MRAKPHPPSLGLRRAKDPEIDPMRIQYRIEITVKLNIAACLFGLAAVLKVLL
jgi:hypothetical protein